MYQIGFHHRWKQSVKVIPAVQMAVNYIFLLQIKKFQDTINKVLQKVVLKFNCTRIGLWN